MQAALSAHFAFAGGVEYVRVPTDMETGAVKGFAFVQMDSVAARDAAGKMNGGQMPDGRWLVVDVNSAATGGGGGGGGVVGGVGGFGGRSAGGGRGAGGGRSGPGRSGPGRGGPGRGLKIDASVPAGSGKKIAFGDE